jgi:oligopeptide transport system ATP-binding protein
MTSSANCMLSAENIVVRYPIKSSVLRRLTGYVHAVEGVSIELSRGETLAIVGESGCGKSTLSRVLVGLRRPTAGEVIHEGKPLSSFSPYELRQLRKRVQLIFQDPLASLNPRLTVRQVIQEAWEVHPDAVPKSQWVNRADEIFLQVGLNPEQADRYPHQFSGGQQQRVGIARALALAPEIIICDEPVSSLDVSVQGQIVALLKRLQRELDLSYVFVSHNLALVRMIADRIAIMYLGKIVEQGTTEEVFRSPTHPYTQALLSAVPIPDPALARRGRRILRGETPSPLAPPSGCMFRARCHKAQDICETDEPKLLSRDFMVSSHSSACHFAAADFKALGSS